MLYFYNLAPTRFGDIAIVWWWTDAGPRIRQVFLTRHGIPASDALLAVYPTAQPAARELTADLGLRLQRFLAGDNVTFDLSAVALEQCGAFQRSVLLAEYGIPRGWVSTYGRIARTVSAPGASRAVGHALATNPFPLIIPCHRAVRSDGALGGYQGGPAMKRTLLEMEGVPFDAAGRVVMHRVYYEI